MMRKSKSIVRLAAVIALALAAGRAPADELASTQTPIRDKLPTYAVTTFNQKYFTQNLDALRICEHELLHGIGFSISYGMFKSHVVKTDDGRLFCTEPSDKKTMIAKLTDETTHIDPKWKEDLMNPDPEVNLRISDLDKKILDTAFNWSGNGGLAVEIVFQGEWDADQKKAVKETAEAAVKAVYDTFSGGKAGTNKFKWYLKETKD
ncbi:MAG TPA: hypothetical protein VGS41_05840 [Chthonomonadales bacterium]|nr:hypothetical protein [Chthonomonadales bacterium]